MESVAAMVESGGDGVGGGGVRTGSLALKPQPARQSNAQAARKL